MTRRLDPRDAHDAAPDDVPVIVQDAADDHTADEPFVGAIVPLQPLLDQLGDPDDERRPLLIKLNQDLNKWHALRVNARSAYVAGVAGQIESALQERHARLVSDMSKARDLSVVGRIGGGS